jgi:tRNA isopentenyl-2-thiomethyl-A-37 hydroxylase MiaE
MSEVLGTLASIKALMEVVAECSKFLSGTILSSPKEAKLGNELRTLEKVLDELLMNVDQGIGTYISSKTLDIVRNYTEACIKDIKKFQKKMSMRSEEKGFKAFLSCLQRQQKEKKTQEFISTIERRKSTLILFLVVNQMG